MLLFCILDVTITYIGTIYVVKNINIVRDATVDFTLKLYPKIYLIVRAFENKNTQWLCFST